MEAFSDLKTPVFIFDYYEVQHSLQQIAAADQAAVEADRKVREYYTSGQPLLWIDRSGVDQRADSLLAWLHLLPEIGMSEHAFGVDVIERDLRRMRTLDLATGDERINQVAARLEYLLTKACLRYATGQRMGFVNPHRIFNRLDVEKVDSVRHTTIYRGLFDIGMDLPSADYYSSVLRKIATDSIASYLRDIQPQGRYYQQLKDRLATAENDEARRRVLCNMERCRWRLHQPIPESGKHVVVNIPAYHLYAYGADSVLDMRVVCGAQKTKTPQLSSEIEWMEVNPQWIIPMSILEKDVSRHAGDTAYFARNRYQIYERATNKQMEVGEVTRTMLLSGKYRVAQQSGSDNSLGRIVFRFKNKFSVFLHYTSSPGVFQRESRAVSHGCVRVARPFELAYFVLDAPDEWLLDRIRISMDLRPQTERGRQFVARHHDEEDRKLIGYVPVKPHVPLHIIYYTLWPDEHGIMQTWPDVYGYDQVVWQQLQPYMQ